MKRRAKYSKQCVTIAILSWCQAAHKKMSGAISAILSGTMHAYTTERYSIRNVIFKLAVQSALIWHVDILYYIYFIINSKH
jgi:hypothetical protein